jgi:eukaryotic-like serine/threonine-protein kinase
MAMQVGARLGPYVLEEQIGAGGMGEVYRARDTRLNRTVAIKVLSADIAREPDRRVRFHREAKAVAALTHPHICVLYDIGQDDGIDYLVMEHLGGETLASRLGRAALPLDAALEYGIQIADALDAAHRAGVIHRDLKPSNIMLASSGAKLLDFGLAKLRTPVLGSDLASAPTVTGPLTHEGTLLGTLQYMAPEQLHGQEADAASDLFALGALLYEMATGRKAFAAASDASLISSILRDEPPPISIGQPHAPRAMDRVVRACLMKNRAERWQSARDVACELRWILEDYRTSAAESDRAPVSRRGIRRAALGAAFVLIGVVSTLVTSSFRKTADAPAPAKFSIQLPDTTVAANSVPVARISPDGRYLAAVLQTGATTLAPILLRRLDAPRAEPVPGTEGALSLAWSPDSRQLGFTTVAGSLKKLSVSDRAIETLCDACSTKTGIGGGAAWSRRGTIVFASEGGRLMSISPDGGEPRAITAPDASTGEIAHVAPYFLPDGQHFVYVSRNTDERRTGLYVRDVAGAAPRLLLQGDHPAIYAPPGYVLFPRSGDIVARAFDERRLEFTGDVTPLVQSSEYWPTPVHSAGSVFAAWYGSWPSFSVSDAGTLTYAITEQPPVQFQWMHRAGGVPQRVGAPGSYQTFDLAVDDSQLLFSKVEAAQASLWTLDLARGVTSRLTFGAASSYFDPRWGPRQQWMAANRKVPVPSVTVLIRPDVGETVVAERGEECGVDDVSDDGQWLLCHRDANRELVAKPLVDAQQPQVVHTSRAGIIDQARFSPDGRWIAYHTNESGRYEVCVTSFPSRGERWQISRDGGVQPLWQADGRALYYLGLDGFLNTVTVQSENPRRFSTPTALFDAGLPGPSPWVEQYAVSADSQRFLVLKAEETKVRNSVGVIVNWRALLRPGNAVR